MDKFSVPSPKRKSIFKHRQDVNRQILLPIILAALAGVGLAILSGFAAAGSAPAVGLWADISIIWLIIPIMLMALVLVALLIALVVGLNRLLKVSPYYTGLAKQYALMFNSRVVTLTDKIIQPVLTSKVWLGLILKSEKKNGRQKRD